MFVADIFVHACNEICANFCCLKTQTYANDFFNNSHLKDHAWIFLFYNLGPQHAYPYSILDNSLPQHTHMYFGVENLLL